jgi:hypothetical protein
VDVAEIDQKIRDPGFFEPLIADALDHLEVELFLGADLDGEKDEQDDDGERTA